MDGSCPFPKFFAYLYHDTISSRRRQENIYKKGSRPGGPGAGEKHSLLAERHAVGALVLGGASLVGAYQDPVQRAVVLVLAVMGALSDGALDGLVDIVQHKIISFSFGPWLVCPPDCGSFTDRIFSRITVED